MLSTSSSDLPARVASKRLSSGATSAFRSHGRPLPLAILGWIRGQLRCGDRFLFRSYWIGQSDRTAGPLVCSDRELANSDRDRQGYCCGDKTMNDAADKRALLDRLRIVRDDEPPRDDRQKRWFVVGVGAVGVMLTVAAMYLFWPRAESDAAIVSAPVRAETPSDITSTTPASPTPPSANAPRDGVLSASGYVTARRLATVSAEITGRVAEVLIEEGVSVSAGQLLARLDPTMAQIEVELRDRQRDVCRGRSRRCRGGPGGGRSGTHAN